MKKKKSLNITLAIFIGLVAGILFGLFMPGRYEFALPVIQSAILENAARYVKPGGVLLYSTCTILRRENQEIVKRFQKAHPEFELCSFSLPVCEETVDGMITLLPHIHKTDGFFVAKFRKMPYYQ